MEIKNLFDPNTYRETVERLNSLSPQSERQWGKMDAAQMLTHCTHAFKVPLSEQPLPRMFIGRLMGWMFRAQLYNDKPWRKGLPTAPSFVVKDKRIFETEKQALMELVQRFHELGPTGAGRFPHPMFGKLTPEQWGKAMWKHLDHHLRQFGV